MKKERTFHFFTNNILKYFHYVLKLTMYFLAYYYLLLKHFFRFLSIRFLVWLQLWCSMIAPKGCPRSPKCGRRYSLNSIFNLSITRNYNFEIWEKNMPILHRTCKKSINDIEHKISIIYTSEIKHTHNFISL